MSQNNSMTRNVTKKFNDKKCQIRIQGEEMSNTNSMTNIVSK